jgi:hypothetical protein
MQKPWLHSGVCVVQLTKVILETDATILAGALKSREMDRHPLGALFWDIYGSSCTHNLLTVKFL